MYDVVKQQLAFYVYDATTRIHVDTKEIQTIVGRGVIQQSTTTILTSNVCHNSFLVLSEAGGDVVEELTCKCTN